ncbi:MAG: Asp-tRNA(Asn)/Glu-tRNA(Gln) amidotransferase subunit GatC [Candidatus Colwellbacteria bacterium]|nr:Asp-tRNA(Asn)/Glu-tRNA(Gln) amidotransferase subunit GatC [Candidatus Colwellbacteria bacterium]
MEFDVRKYASLARIRLTEEEQTKYQKDLEEILGHVAELTKVNTDGVEPMTGGTELRNVFREDVLVEKDVFAPSFPQESSNHLKVPKILDYEA